MGNLLKYYIIILIMGSSFGANCQFLCDYEYKLIKKQKSSVKNKAKGIVKEWYANNAERLSLPRILKFSTITISPEEDLRWEEIDSLLCVKARKVLVTQAKNKLVKFKLVVFEIKAHFDFENTKNPGIKSVIFFKFDIKGDLIVIVIREKENSPFSEKYYH